MKSELQDFLTRRILFLRSHIRTKIGLELLTDLHVSSPAEYEKVLLECRLSVSICVCMDGSICTSLTPERLNGFKSLSVVDRCSVNRNILAPKTGFL
jgi:hypothetical protein